MKQLDEQMRAWSTRLRDDLKITPAQSNRLASTIAGEVSILPRDVKQRVISASQVPLKERIDELVAFQSWMDLAHTIRCNPAVTRAQVIAQNYVCFVYLKDSCFNILVKEAPKGSATEKCCHFLVTDPVKAFRNAISHANWRYAAGFSGLEFWALTGSGKNRKETKFEVSQQELDFWQALARCTGYAVFLSI